MRFLSLFVASLGLLLFSPQNCSGKTVAEIKEVSLKVYLLDIPQLQSLYKGDSDSLVQKKQSEMIGRRFFIVVEAQNVGEQAVRGDIFVTYEGRIGYEYAKDIVLERNMQLPDYFVWPESRALVYGWEDSFPEVEACWTKLRVLKTKNK